MVISGVVYQSDGKKPAPNVIIYYYHTNSAGLYAQSKGQIQGKRHGEIRGWVKTNSKGEYKIFTSVPAAYPRERIPAHVHMVVKEPGLNEYYIDEIQFDDDPFLTTAERKKNPGRGGSGVIITDEERGVIFVERNITLGLHIPDYPVKNTKDVPSGLSVGESCPAFEPLHLSGADSGKVRCPMCSYGTGQGMMIWWNNHNTDQLVAFMKKLDLLIDKAGLQKLRVFVIYMNPERKSFKAMTKDLNHLVLANGIRNCAVLCLNGLAEDNALREYQINRAALNTILIYRRRKVIDKFVNVTSLDSGELLNRLAL